MSDEPVELDEHRGMAAQKSTELRRLLRVVRIDQARLRRQRDDFERYLRAAPATTWAQVATKVRYLLRLYAATPGAQDPRHQKLIADTLDDLARLSARPSPQPSARPFGDTKETP